MLQWLKDLFHTHDWQVIARGQYDIVYKNLIRVPGGDRVKGKRPYRFEQCTKCGEERALEYHERFGEEWKEKDPELLRIKLEEHGIVIPESRERASLGVEV